MKILKEHELQVAISKVILCSHSNFSQKVTILILFTTRMAKCILERAAIQEYRILEYYPPPIMIRSFQLLILFTRKYPATQVVPDVQPFSH